MMTGAPGDPTTVTIITAVAVTTIIVTATRTAVAVMPVLALAQRPLPAWDLALLLLPLVWLWPIKTTTQTMTVAAAHAVVARLAPAPRVRVMTTVAVNPRDASTWQVQAWQVLRPLVSLTGITVVRVLGRVIAPVLAAKCGKHSPLWRVAWVPLLLLDSTRRIKRSGTGISTGKYGGRRPVTGPRQTCTPIPQGIRLI